MLKTLTIFLGEDADGLIKEYLVSFVSYLQVSRSCQRDTQIILAIVYYKREIFSTVRTTITSEPWLDC